jgi:hypothetical protein
MSASVITGLAKIKEELAKRPSSGDFEEKDPARWVSLKDGDSFKVTFLNEIDEGSPNYDANRGVAVLSTQHANPENWRKTAACTANEGDCYGCANSWRQKYVLYFNALVDDGKEAPYVAIFSRALGKGSIAQALVDMASDEDFDHSVTDKTFKLSRTGKTKDDTTYTLSPLPKKSVYKEVVDAKNNKVDLKDAELFDLPKYIFTVSPERQEAYYNDQPMGGNSSGSSRPAPVAVKAVNETW